MVAYGKILPRAVLDALPRGCINVHALAAADVSRRGAGPVGGDPRRARDRRVDHAARRGHGHRAGAARARASRSVPTRPRASCSRGSRRSAPRRSLEAIAAIAAGTRAPTRAGSRARDARADARQDRRRDRLRAAGGARSPRGSAASIRGRARRRVLRGQVVKLFRARAIDGDRRRRAGARDRRRAARTSRAATARVAIRELQAAGQEAACPRRSSRPAAASRSATCSRPARGRAMTAREVARRVLDRVDGRRVGDAGARRRARARRASTSAIAGSPPSSSTACCATARGSIARSPRTPTRAARRRACVTALRVAAYQLLFLDRVPAYAAVDDAVGAARAAGGAKLAGFANAVLRKVAARGEPALPADGRARLELEPRCRVDRRRARRGRSPRSPTRAAALRAAGAARRAREPRCAPRATR